MVNTYSPSTGKLWVMDAPPRDPNGSFSLVRSSWSRRAGTAKVSIEAPAGSGTAGRRHLVATKLPNDLLPGVCVRPDTIDLDALEREPAGLHAFVVAGQAVLVYQLAIERRACGLGPLRNGESEEQHRRGELKTTTPGSVEKAHILGQNPPGTVSAR